MADPTSTQEAAGRGYTLQVVVEGDGYPVGLGAFIKPDTDLDGRFSAFDSDHQRMVTIDGSTVAVRNVD